MKYVSSSASEGIAGGDSLVIAGEYIAVSDPESEIRDVPIAARFGLGSDVAVAGGGAGSEVGASAPFSGASIFVHIGSSAVGELPCVFF